MTVEEKVKRAAATIKKRQQGDPPNHGDPYTPTPVAQDTRRGHYNFVRQDDESWGNGRSPVVDWWDDGAVYTSQSERIVRVNHGPWRW